MQRVTILGSGIVGVTAAYALARRGCEVTVVDRAPGPGAGGATSRNGAQLSYSYADAFASPLLLSQIPALLLGRDLSHKIRPNCSREFLRWCLSVFLNASQGKFDANTLATLKLALESRVAMHELMRRHKIDFAFRRSSKLHLYRTPIGLERARRVVALKEGFGLGQEVLSAREVIVREPHLEHLGVPLAGGVLSPIDESGDGHLFASHLGAILRETYGVRFHQMTQVRQITVSRGKVVAVVTADGSLPSDTVVVALGVETRQLLRPLGIDVPIWPVRGYSVTLPVIDTSPRISVTEAAAKIVFCHLGSKVRIAGIADIGFDGDDKSSDRRILDLMNIAKAVLPKAADYNAEPNGWFGLRPMTPSSQPLIGPTRIGGLYLNCGQGCLAGL